MTVWLCIVQCCGELAALVSRRGMFTVTDYVLAYPVKSLAFLFYLWNHFANRVSVTFWNCGLMRLNISCNNTVFRPQRKRFFLSLSLLLENG